MIYRHIGSMVRTTARPIIRGVIFDMGHLRVTSGLIVDGTLCLPQNWMFGHMRAALGIDDKIDILTHIESLPTPEERRIAHAKIEKVEDDAMNKMIAQEGLAPLMKVTVCPATKLTIVLERTGLANGDMHTKYSQTRGISDRELLARSHVRSCIITRSFEPPKPHPAPILHITKQWNLDPHDVLMVGDGLHDMESANAAGAIACLIKHDWNVDAREKADFLIDKLGEIEQIIERHSQ